MTLTPRAREDRRMAPGALGSSTATSRTAAAIRSQPTSRPTGIAAQTDESVRPCYPLSRGMSGPARRAGTLAMRRKPHARPFGFWALSPPSRDGAGAFVTSWLEAETAGGGDHGGSTFVDGMDDLGVAYSTEIHGGDPEIRVPELPLDEVVGRLPVTSRPRVRAAVGEARNDAAPPLSHPCRAVGSGFPPRCMAARGSGHGARRTARRPAVARGSRATERVDPTPIRPSRPRYVTALATSDEHCAATRAQIALGESECLADPYSAAPEHDIRPRSLSPRGRRRRRA
jgi:hypothetical protein